MASKLRPYQRKGVRQILNFKGRVLLADEMRLGKTIQALWFLKRMERRRKFERALVICPANAKWVWSEQAKQHIDMESTVLEGTRPIRPLKYADLKKTWPKLTVINYDILHPWKRFLRRMKFDVIIMDECHYIKARGRQGKNVKRKNSCLSLASKVPYVIAISGTPIVNHPSEFWNVLSLLRPDIFDNWMDFAYTFCKPKYNGWGWDYSGHSNTKQLNRLLKKTCMIRRRRKDVYPDLPEKDRQVITLPLTDPKQYRKAEMNFLEWLKDYAPDRVEAAERAEQLVKRNYLRRLASELKIKFVYEWVRDFLDETDEKLAIFAISKPAIKYMRDRFKHLSVVVDGSVRGKKRHLTIKQFQQDKDTRLFIGQIHATGVAIELKPANTLAFYELDWVPGNHLQVEDRIVHVEDKVPWSINYLVAKDTIDSDMCKIIQSKTRTLGEVLDGTADADDMNIFDELNRMANERAKLWK